MWCVKIAGPPAGIPPSSTQGLVWTLAGVVFSCCCGEEELGCARLNPAVTGVRGTGQRKHAYRAVHFNEACMSQRFVGPSVVGRWSCQGHQCSNKALTSFPRFMHMEVHPWGANSFLLQPKQTWITRSMRQFNVLSYAGPPQDYNFIRLVYFPLFLTKRLNFLPFSLSISNTLYMSNYFSFTVLLLTLPLMANAIYDLAFWSLRGVIFNKLSMSLINLRLLAFLGRHLVNLFCLKRFSTQCHFDLFLKYQKVL